jgi:arylsulfatase
VRRVAPSIVVAIVVAGAFTGLADTLLTLAASPDPGLLTYRLSYVFGPVLFALVWAGPTGAVVAELCRRRAREARAVAAVAAGSIQAIWAMSLLVDGWRAGQSPFALLVLAGALVIAAVALTRLAVDTAAWFGVQSRRRRGALTALAAGILFGGVLAGTPRGTSSFRGGGLCAGDPAPTAHQNVLLITIDALRADVAREMRSYRRLAANGTEFTQHVTTSPWTLPSMASLLTGLAPADHRAGESLSSRSLVPRSPLGRDVETVAAMLGARGIVTHAIATNPYLTARYGIDRGFCTFENVSMEGEAVRALAQTTQLRLARALAPAWLPSDRAPEIRARAERWLGRRGDRPFFLWLHFLDPHAPYGDRDGSPTSLVLDLMAFQRDGATGTPFRGVGLVRAGEYRPGPQERRRIRALYQEDVDTVDRELGMLLDYVETRGLRERTAIILTADHGEEFWDHGSLEHGRTLYEEVLRVPLVVAAPNHAQASCGDLTTVLDVTPTILALAGTVHAKLPGRDLFGRTRRPVESLPIGQVLFGESWSGVRRASCKSMRSEYGEERTFDLGSDPEERRNLSAIPEGGCDDQVSRLNERSWPVG